MAARHHVYDTQEQDRLCAFLDMLALSEDQQLVAVHCIPDVGGPHWFVIWKQYTARPKGAFGFSLTGGNAAVERRDGQTITAAPA